MAKVEITFWAAGQNARFGNAVMPVGQLKSAFTEVITSSGTAQSTMTASPADGFVRVYSDGDVWIRAGGTAAVPTGVGTGIRVPAYAAVDVAVDKGDKISVINA